MVLDCFCCKSNINIKQSKAHYIRRSFYKVVFQKLCNSKEKYEKSTTNCKGRTIWSKHNLGKIQKHSKANREITLTSWQSSLSSKCPISLHPSWSLLSYQHTCSWWCRAHLWVGNDENVPRVRTNRENKAFTRHGNHNNYSKPNLSLNLT